MLQLLRRDLQVEQSLRSQREEQLLQAQKQLHEQQQEYKDADRRLNSHMKDLSNKISEGSQSIGMLEQRLREKEALADKLEQEKGRIGSSVSLRIILSSTSTQKSWRTMQRDR